MLTFLHVHLNNMCGTPGPRLNQNNCSQKNLLLYPVILKQKEFCFAICYSHGLCLWTEQEITKVVKYDAQMQAADWTNR